MMPMWVIPLAPPPLSTSPTDCALRLHNRMNMDIMALVRRFMVSLLVCASYFNAPNLVIVFVSMVLSVRKNILYAGQMT